MASSTPSRPLHLLLLPPPPHPATRKSLRLAYEAPIAATLKQLALERRREPVGSVLEVAVPLPAPLTRDRLRSRAAAYDEVQSFVAGVYGLVCAVAARDKVNVEDDRGVDVRLLPLSPSPPPQGGEEEGAEGGEGGAGGSEPAAPPLITPIPDLRTLARSQRPWSYVACPESKEGDAVLHDFLVGQDGHVSVRRVPAGSAEGNEPTTAPPANGDGVGRAEGTRDAPDDPAAAAAAAAAAEDTHHSSVILGGTFDHIHAGHKLLLYMFAFVLGEIVEGDGHAGPHSMTIGITGDELLKNKAHRELLEGWEERQAGCVAFLRGFVDFRPAAAAGVATETSSAPGPNGHVVRHRLGDGLCIACVELSDPYGPTVTDEHVTALVVSAETRGGGRACNERRREKGWRELAIFEVELLHADEEAAAGAGEGSREAADAGLESSIRDKLSSTAIRRAIKERRDATTT